MSTANKKRSPFEILGLNENNLSLRKIQNAYQNLKKQLDEGTVQYEFTYDELDKAFQELVMFADNQYGTDPEEEVISAKLLPNMKSRNKIKKDENNIIYIHKEIPKNIHKKNKEPDNISRPIDSLMNMKNSMKKVRANYAENPEYIKKIENILSESEEITGNLLKKLREELKVSIEEIANRIKVSKTYLEAIENDSYISLPAEVYVRGFFSSYLNYLGLDRKDIIEALIEVYRTRRRLTKRK